MGRLFRAGTLLLMWVVAMEPAASAQSHNQRIPSPFVDRERPPRPPPAKSSDEAKQDLRRLKLRRTKRQNKVLVYEKTLGERLDEVTLNPGDLSYWFSASLAYHVVSTSGDERQEYKAAPGAHFHWYVQPATLGKQSDFQLWSGFRLVPITGSGVMDGVAGRFGFLYFGPMIGLGRVSAFYVGDPDAVSNQETKVAPRLYTRSGLFLMSGLALQSRTGMVEDGREAPKDFDRTSLALDAPGLWLEVTSSEIHYSKISYNWTLGVQMGEGKNFFYLAFGVGFWD